MAQILRPVAYARICHIRLHPLHITHSTENRKSAKLRFERIHEPSEATYREHPAVNLTQSDFYSTREPVSVTAVFCYMNHIPCQRGYIDEGVWLVMRRNVVNGIFGRSGDLTGVSREALTR